MYVFASTFVNTARAHIQHETVMQGTRNKALIRVRVPPLCHTLAVLRKVAQPTHSRLGGAATDES